MTIDGIAAGGDGVGRVEGLAVFVPRTAPGDVIQAAYTAHARHGRGRVLQLLESSSHRVEPRCRHYEADGCGGCQLQHLDGETQRRARQQIVQETLRRVGRRDIALPPITADLEWHYRGRLTLALRRRGSGWVGGLHPHDDAQRVFALEYCEISHPLLVETWRTLRSLLADRTVPLPETDALRLSLRLEGSAAEQGMEREMEQSAATSFGTAGMAETSARLQVALVVQGGQSWPDRDRWAARVHALAPQVHRVWWEREDGTREGGAAAAAERGADEARPEASEALAFAQVNARVADALRAHVFAAVMEFAPVRVVDGYAGTGLLTERLAREGREVVAVEADPVGAQRAADRLRAAGEDIAARAEVRCELMEHALPRLATPGRVPDVVVLNPPRRGVDARVTAWLEEPAMRAARGIVYVSCDPATLARDLSRLPSWGIVSVRCFDMFPQTAHVETVCVLQRSQEREAA